MKSASFTSKVIPAPIVYDIDIYEFTKKLEEKILMDIGSCPVVPKQ